MLLHHLCRVLTLRHLAHKLAELRFNLGSLSGSTCSPTVYTLTQSRFTLMSLLNFNLLEIALLIFWGLCRSLAWTRPRLPVLVVCILLILMSRDLWRCISHLATCWLRLQQAVCLAIWLSHCYLLRWSVWVLEVIVLMSVRVLGDSIVSSQIFTNAMNPLTTAKSILRFPQWGSFAA